MGTTEVRIRTWVRASDADLRTGLIGYLSVFYGAMVLDGITLRRTSDGKFRLAFPSRTDRRGQKHAIVRPVDDDARQAVEREILAQLGQHEEVHA